jgi:AcrR family transcriptional regulator
MSATRPRMTSEERRLYVVGAACRVFARSSYSGATTAEIARESGVTEPVIYRHFASKRDLYLACLDAAWFRVRQLWEDVLAGEPDPGLQLGAMGRAYVQLQRHGDKIMLSDLWIQALNEAGEDPKIRRYLRDQVREVHDFVAERIRGSQRAGGIVKERDPDAEAWIFISLGLLSTIDRRLGTVGDHDFEGVFASRRAWMIGETVAGK